MKIGINARFLLYPHTGIGQYTLHLIEGLMQLDHKNQYELYTPEPVELMLSDNFRQIRVQEKPFRSASLKKAHWEHQLLPREMEQRGVELAHFLYPGNPWRTLPFPVVVTVHDVIPWVLPEYRKKWRSKIYHAYAKHALKKADHLIVVSDFTKQELQKIVGKKTTKDISVIPNCTPDNETTAHPDLRLRRDYFLYVGGYDPRKNVPKLMAVYQEFIAPFYPVDLILVNGKNQGLEAYLTDAYARKITDQVHLKNRGKIIFTEPLESQELYFLYKKALCFVHLSRYEGFNLPLLEALYFGTPALCSDLPVHREVARDGALFVALDAPETIGRGMQQMIGDKPFRRATGLRGKKRARDFSLKNHAEKTLDVYNLFS